MFQEWLKKTQHTAPLKVGLQFKLLWKFNTISTMPSMYINCAMYSELSESGLVESFLLQVCFLNNQALFTVQLYSYALSQSKTFLWLIKNVHMQMSVWSVANFKGIKIWTSFKNKVKWISKANQNLDHFSIL